MSYSFSVTGGSKDEAVKKVEEELGKVVEGQPSHAADREAAQNAAKAFIDILEDPAENQQIVVYVNGSLSWREENKFTSASVSVSAYLAEKA